MGAMLLYEVMGSGGDVVGPVSEELVAKALAAGRIPDDARYRLAGAAEWLPIETFSRRDASQTVPLVAPTVEPVDAADGDLTLLVGADEPPKARPAPPVVRGGAPAVADPGASYASAYSVSGTLESFGGFLKFCAVIAGVVGVAVGLSLDHTAVKAMFVVGGLVLALMLAAFGLLWAALGQILRALLDTAVHTKVLATRTGWTAPR